MLYSLYDIIRHNASRGQQGKLGCFCQEHPRREDRFENCRFLTSHRGPETGVDGGSFGFDANEPKPLGPGGKCSRASGLEKQATAGTSDPFNASDISASRKRSGAITPGVWTKPGELGRADSSRPLEETVWDEAEGSASSELDASARVSDETRRIYVPPSQNGGSQAVSPGLKKNFKIWVLGRPWSSRMRRDSACILGWGGFGPRKDNAFASRQPANINIVSMFRAGWRRFWVGMA